ncbi:hypothetical protein GCM10023328_02500 [Modestobacter marinus]|uniref:Uncharacterized protein n=1 Tax=Modestobacter marinus TaxID=477641 RepID=A0ABQ2FU23_9ACTN|nr:hypothetical protein GCM10011589_07460 [Modestobacter marinus]
MPPSAGPSAVEYTAITARSPDPGSEQKTTCSCPVPITSTTGSLGSRAPPRRVHAPSRGTSLPLRSGRDGDARVRRRESVPCPPARAGMIGG